MDTLHTPRINGPRLWQSLMDLGALGATPKGGVCRIALTEEDKQGRDLVVRWCREAGLEIRVDEIGNVFARRAGSDPAAPAVATGSHIDTQPSGGKFDGNFGVLAGLEVMRTLNDLGVVTRAPLEVAIWTNEEGTRFTPVMMGSGVFAGVFDADFAREQADRAGITVGDALDAIGYRGAQKAGEVPGGMYAAYFEAHIEQGPVLEAAGLPIGVVSGALGQQWYDVVVTGQDAHAGPTPLALRHDAMLAAARMVEAVNRIARDEAPHGRGTVGYLEVKPNSRNVIPGRVDFAVDFRNLSQDGLDRMDAAMRAAFAGIADAAAVQVEIRQVVKFEPCVFAPSCVEAVRKASELLGLPSMEVVSGAGHDAVYVAQRAPTGMIFVPCKDGISHNELEDALPEHIEAGANVLLQAMLSVAG
ncbi:Zn-dependent hydrolase [Cupriavidus plantarum]|uniref:Zn-dependent hydrolase n=2 Tax=Cupriavidus plantarum TaxID=942865 RepID=UPI000E2839DF|nr:Zn-dependent hydrolase [Cupriavidus plantarum]REF02144.1 N-carbamoyl-L-amino-acid hydrolase [Cupriavidus plantarum]RLK45009.1 N-carbamoyl-L-amino-acid hydrolase [Cupriavidus plantarum]